MLTHVTTLVRVNLFWKLNYFNRIDHICHAIKNKDLSFYIWTTCKILFCISWTLKLGLKYPKICGVSWVQFMSACMDTSFQYRVQGLRYLQQIYSTHHDILFRLVWGILSVSQFSVNKYNFPSQGGELHFFKIKFSSYR